MLNCSLYPLVPARLYQPSQIKRYNHTTVIFVQHIKSSNVRLVGYVTVVTDAAAVEPFNGRALEGAGSRGRND